MRKIVKIARNFCAIAFASGILLSCAAPTREANTQAENIVWPAAPSAPRIVYLRSVSTPEDLGISRGFVGFLKGLTIGEEDNRMVLPMAVAKIGKGQIFVADSGKKGIHRFDTEKKTYRFIVRERKLNFASPVGLASDKEGNLYITDSELAKVFIVSPGANHAKRLPLSEDFIRPTGITVDQETGWIYVVDTGAHAVFVFEPDYQLIKRFGHRGTGDGEFNFPTHIYLGKDKRVLVTDSLNFRVQIFDRYGGYIKKFGIAGNGSGDMARPKGVIQDDSGNIYVADSLFHTVQIFDDSGNFLLDYGQQGTGPGEFWLPAGMTISDDGTIYVADSYNKRVQVFRYVGNDP